MSGVQGRGALAGGGGQEQLAAPVWPGVDVRWLANDAMGASKGCGLLVTVPAGHGYEVHGHAATERVVYVVSGRGEHREPARTVSLAADDVLIVPPGSWHGFTSDPESESTLWILYAPATRFPADDYLRPDVAPAASPSRVVKRNLRDTPDAPEISTADNGFETMRVIWDGARGAQAITLGLAFFGGAGHHRWHRHPEADEIIYIPSGSAVHRTDTREVPLDKGAYEFSPAGEWHTMPVEQASECVFAYLGAADLAGTGYQTRGLLP